MCWCETNFLIFFSFTRCYFKDASNQQQMVVDGNGVKSEPMNVQSPAAVPNQMFDNSQNANVMSQTFRPPLPPTHARLQRLPLQNPQQMIMRPRLPQQVCYREEN